MSRFFHVHYEGLFKRLFCFKALQKAFFFLPSARIIGMTTVDSKLICDFCGKQCETVQRIALDKDYDRITVKHQIKYACQECSEKKEKERRKQ